VVNFIDDFALQLLISKLILSHLTKSNQK